MNASTDLIRASIDKPVIDLAALRSYRLERVREQMKRTNTAFCVLVNPVSLRYAVDLREYQGFQSRIPSQYLFVPADGPIVLHGSNLRGHELIDDYRTPSRLTTFDGGLDLADEARRFAHSLKDFLTELGLAKTHRRVGIEMLNPSVTQAVLQVELEPTDAQSLIERAKSIKSTQELACMQHSIAVAEYAMARMQALMEPGLREVELWSVMHQVNIAHEGDWFDGRMLCSGSRTNPWLQEASDKVIEAGDLVAFDTDMVGPFGYCADISRTWLCGPAEPTVAQTDVYRRAYDEVQHNLELVRPGMGFLEFSEKALQQPEEFVAHRYPTPLHGVGMSDEYPKTYYRQDVPNGAYDGVIEENMTLCVESFVGSDQGGPGAKLEEVVRVTDSGYEILTDYPFEEELLAR